MKDPMTQRRDAIRLAGLVLLAGATFGIAPALAADNVVPAIVRATPGVLNLRTGDVDTTQTPNLLAGDQPFAPGQRYVLMLDGPLDPARAAALTGAGVLRRGYLPLNAFAADLDQTTPQALRGLGFVTWVGEYQDAWRMDPLVGAGPNGRNWETAPRQALAQAGEVAITVWLFEGLPEQSLQQAMSALPGCQITNIDHVGGAASLSAILPFQNVAQLAARADVQYIEHQAEYTERSNARVRALVQSGTVNNTPLYDRGLRGEGQILGLIDNYLNINHCSFSDTVPIGPNHRKILAYNTFLLSSSHGTHVGGTFCGDAGTPGDTRGVAYASKFVFNYFPSQSEPGVFGRFDLHASQGARVHNNSWGDSSIRTYDGGCRAIDAISFEQEENLIVFAVTDLSAPVTNPENAKNCLAVTASGGVDLGGVASQEFWCIGGSATTTDGRRKPEISAPGCSTASSSSTTTCGVISFTGTSMAAPAAAGAGALIRQYFTSGFYPSGLPNASDGFTPSGQLIKAALVNSAVDMTGEPGFPSAREGWGRVQADNATYFDGDNRRLLIRDVFNSSPNALSTGSQVSVPVEVSAGQPLKITLAWADAPAAVNATFAPINDLDLLVISPTGDVYFGNFFVGGQSSPGGNRDSINNLEQVLVNAPVAGEWTISILGIGVNVGTQGYALVATGGVSQPAPCPADYNQDGNTDQGDIDALVQDLAAGTISYPPSDPDVNRDGNSDQGDIDYLINVIAGAPCP